MTTRKKGLKIFAVGMMSLALPLSFVGFAGLGTTTAYASDLGEYSSAVSITNGSFDEISSTYLDGNPTGWKRFYGTTGARTMVIDTVTNYSTYGTNTYYLTSNPGSDYSVGENKILMINSATAAPSGGTVSTVQVSEGYSSNDITLDANSFYEFSVAVKTASFDDSTEFASVYISGLVDEDGNELELSSTNIRAKEWRVEYFYITTGAQSQTITIDLWLGSETSDSRGVAFFDAVQGTKLSANAYYELKALRDEDGKTYHEQVIDNGKIVDTTDLNFDFEKDLSQADNSLVDWTRPEATEGAHAAILQMNEGNFKNRTGLEYPGDDYSYNNTQSMVLWTESEGFVRVESKPFDIKAFGLYKLTLRVKFTGLESGSFYARLDETDAIINEFSYLDGHYTLESSTSSAVSENGTNNFINGYNEISFYIQGHNRYDSQVTLSLLLGTEDSPALGGVVIDSIVLEQVSSEDFVSDSNILTLSVASDDEESITNGYFTRGQAQDENLTFPILPEGFELTQSDSHYDKAAGIINIYSKYFDEYANAGYTWAQGLSNPGSPDDYSTSDDVNNILMMFNSQSDYQSLTSSTFELATGDEAYYNFTFRFKTLGSASINIRLVDEDGIVILYDKNLSTNDAWSTYSAIINPGEASSTITAIIEFGTEENPVRGYAFLDNMELLSATSDEFANAQNPVDLSGFMLANDPNGEIGNNITSPNAYTSSLEAGSTGAAEGGIIAGPGNDSFGYKNNPESIDDGTLTNNVLVISTTDRATYSLTSKFTIDLSESSYYVLKFRLLTALPDEVTYTDSNGDEQKYSFGVSIGLSSHTLVSELKSNEGWQEYEIYFYASEASETNFVFKLISQNFETSGLAYLTDISWESTDQATYDALESNPRFDTTVFKAAATEESTDDSGDDSTDTGSTEEPDNSYVWLLIPSLIFGVAIILAVILFFIRKFKWNKVERKEKGAYDREQSLHQDVITNEAKRIRDIEVQKVKSHIEELQSQISELEEENKKTINQAREDGKVTKEVERKFKLFAQKRTKLQKNVEELKEHLSLIESPDYLLTVEKRILANRKRTEALQAKQAKKQAKEKQPQNDEK